MRFWTRLADWLKLPEPWEHLDGWAFDGKRVFVETFVQRKGPVGQEDGIPVAGCDWWYSYLVRKTFHRKEIFESKREAVEYALGYIDDRIKRLQKTREAVVEDWRGHLTPVE